MALINAEQFEALWAGAKAQPMLRKVIAQPAQLDFSLTKILTQYMAMATKFHNTGKISQADFEALTAAVAALNTILVRINDKDLVAESMTPPKK
jgi:hypothetical protein